MDKFSDMSAYRYARSIGVSVEEAIKIMSIHHSPSRETYRVTRAKRSEKVVLPSEDTKVLVGLHREETPDEV